VAEQGLLVFADYTCPYCFLAEVVLTDFRREGMPVESASFELRPAGTPLPSPAESWMRMAWEQRVAPLAAELATEMRYPTLSTRTRKAHEAAAYARSEGAFDAMHGALYRAYWQEGRDIGRIDVLTELAGEVGLDRGGMRVALDIDQWAARVDQDRALAARLRLTAVPAYVRLTDGAVHAGLQRYHELEEWVNRNDL
jgi:predicted DsbA family dithiol-disulfide isomerase